MNRLLKSTVTILSIGLVLTGIILPLTTVQKPYNFRDTAVKVIGSSGHGSGSVIDSTNEKSLVLTNRHVCNRATLTKEERREVMKLQVGLFVCMFGKKEQCDKAVKKYKDYMASLNGTGKPITIQFNNLNLPNIKGVVKKVSDHADLCLVEIPKGELPTIRLSSERPQPGTKVIALGNPADMTNHQTDGYIGDDIDYMGNTYTHHTAEIYGGSSGGPCVNMDGELVGLNTLGTNLPTQSYIVPIEDIVLFLQGNMLIREIDTEIDGLNLLSKPRKVGKNNNVNIIGVR